MDISSFPCTQLVFAFSLGWTLKEVNINGDFNQYIWAFSLGWTQETDVRVTSSSLLISSGKPEEVFPTNIFSVLNECPPLSTEPKLFNTIPTQFLLSHFYLHWFSTEPVSLLTVSAFSLVWMRRLYWNDSLIKLIRIAIYIDSSLGANTRNWGWTREVGVMPDTPMKEKEAPFWELPSIILCHPCRLTDSAMRRHMGRTNRFVYFLI